LWCWGNIDVTNTSRVEKPSETPQRIGADTDWSRVAAGFVTALALKTDGSLWGWSWNAVLLGVGAQTRLTYRAPEPARIGTDRDWTQIAAGGGQYLALKGDGSLWAWGINESGEMGDGTTNYQLAPTPIGTDHDWTAITAGGGNSYGLKRDGTLWGWGFGNVGGWSGNDLSPRQIDSVGNVVAISAHEMFLLALRSDGTLWICGPNSHGAASAYVRSPARNLVQIGKAADWTEVYAGNQCFFARKRSGSWWVCGHCMSAPRGAPTQWSPVLLASPRRLPLRFEAWALAPGYGDAALLTRDGTLWTLSISPDVSKFALGLAKLKRVADQALAFLPHHPQPFNLKEFRVDVTPRKLWELPAEVRLRTAARKPSQPRSAETASQVK